MNRCSVRVALIVLGLLAGVLPAPAPLIYTPGEGWRYEQVGGGGQWQKPRAKDQLEVAQTAFDKGNISLALKAAKRTATLWPFSDFAPQAQYLLGRCHEAKGQDEAAFKAYQKLIDTYPKLENYDEVLKRQEAIADRFLAGQWFKAWNVVPMFPSMDKTIKFYDQIIKNGPYSTVAPLAQMNIGAANEQKFFSDYPEAARAYERAADRYADQRAGTDAMFKAGLSYTKQARRAEYDQSIAGQAIATFTDFSTLHPEDARVPEAQKVIDSLRTEQARGAYEVAKFYEKKHRWDGALIYYNEVLLKDARSQYAEEARLRIDAIKKKVTH